MAAVQRRSETSIQDVELVEHIAATIETHYAEPLTLHEISRRVGRHPNAVGLIFRRVTGVTVRTYLTRRRLESAAALILHGEKIEAVSMCVGYRSKTSFYRQFKRYFGVTPTEYRHHAA